MTRMLRFYDYDDWELNNGLQGLKYKRIEWLGRSENGEGIRKN